MIEHLDFELGSIGGLKGCEVVNKFIATVPYDWHDLTGQLEVPELYVHNGRVMVDTGFRFGPYCDGEDLLLTRAPDDDEEDPPLPDVIGLAEGKLPLFVRFVEAGAFGGSMNRDAFVRAKGVATTWIKRGYRGPLNFSRDARGPENEWSARCGIFCFSRDLCGARPILPWRLRLEWETRRGGRYEHVQMLAELARALSLPERKQTNAATSAA